MFTTSPIPPVVPDHVGFYMVAAFVIAIWIAYQFDTYDFGERLVSTGIAALIIWFSAMVSYVWTDQDTKFYANTPVTGEFVRHLAEGWSETRSNGKHTRQVDVHKTYVVYRINGSEVLFPATTGVAYPPKAVFYHNPVAK